MLLSPSAGNPFQHPVADRLAAPATDSWRTTDLPTLPTLLSPSARVLGRTTSNMCFKKSASQFFSRKISYPSHGAPGIRMSSTSTIALSKSEYSTPVGVPTSGVLRTLRLAGTFNSALMVPLESREIFQDRTWSTPGNGASPPTVRSSQLRMLVLGSDNNPGVCAVFWAVTTPAVPQPVSSKYYPLLHSPLIPLKFRRFCHRYGSSSSASASLNHCTWEASTRSRSRNRPRRITARRAPTASPSTRSPQPLSTTMQASYTTQ